jgi:aspartyl-tRNA(Asn)/glutamyl-tRNA(Gln) amidotransferase subunit A
MSKLNELSITQASAKLAAGEITSVELTRACIEEAKKRNPELNAYLEIFDDAEAQAREADARRARGESHPLLGIPLAIKDNILIKGRIASAASKMLENYVASYDATVIQKLKEAGAVFLGRTNMDEFAMGGSNENSAFGPAKNPHDESRVPGGSSGGSAAAVAAHMALGALGTETGGSVREPASFCGLVGVKPTYGGISRSGIMAMAASLNQCGIFGKTVSDAELLFNTIAGQDPLDSQTISPDLYPKKEPKKKIGVPRALLTKGINTEILKTFEEKLNELRSLGYEIVDIDVPSASLALAIYYIIVPAEVSTDLARFDGVRYGLSIKGDSLVEDYAKTRAQGFGAEVRRRVLLGTYVLSSGYYDAYYGKATVARAKLTKEFVDALEEIDVIATPTTPSVAPKIGEVRDPLSMYLLDMLTVSANLTGHPAISIPMGEISGLPVGIQFTAAHGDEATMFAVGKALLCE